MHEDKLLIKSYTQALCVQQIQANRMRHQYAQTRLNRYFNSTQRRNTFSRLMCLATYVNALYTPSYIAEQLFISRQATHQMIRDCLEEGWVEYQITDTGAKGYRATAELIEAMEDYAERYFQTVQLTGLHSAFDVIDGTRKMRQSGLR